MAWKTAVFRLAEEHGWKITQLARAMEMDLSTLTRVRRGTMTPGNRFRIGAKRAFPTYPDNTLVWWEPDPQEDRR